ncbi:hypothetical protein DFJ77DRAFT_115607 [Powellomyces hirtus]|nr:hypothetical protein DFJ77DRAFT_115607 [Powellomyces hirtus]
MAPVTPAKDEEMTLAELTVADRACLLDADFNVSTLAGLESVLARKLPPPCSIAGLRSAIDRISTMHCGVPVQSQLIPQILAWARDERYAPTMDQKLLLAKDTTTAAPQSGIRQVSATVSARTARYILANAFFLNVEGSQRLQIGSLLLGSLYRSTASAGIERLTCLLAYFAQEYLDDRRESEREDRNIIFERVRITSAAIPAWSHLPDKVVTDSIHLFENAMEDTGSRNIMDFANRRIHIHCIIPSATQEEVLFSCCPEAFVSLILYDTLEDDEVAVIRNVRRYVRYSGYLDTFRCEGFFREGHTAVTTQPHTGIQTQSQSGSLRSAVSADRIETLLVADAVTGWHRQPRSVDRDLTKAYLVFRLALKGGKENAAVATGHWGCGIFGGDKMHKFAQQVCAATVAGVPLNYALFGDTELLKAFRTQLERWKESDATIRSIYATLL